jgi:hypothetical protein
MNPNAIRGRRPGIVTRGRVFSDKEIVEQLLSIILQQPVSIF